MACVKCDFKGFIEDTILIHNGEKALVRQCRECNDIAAYSKRVQVGLAIQNEIAIVHAGHVINVDFKGKKLANE